MAQVVSTARREIAVTQDALFGAVADYAGTRPRLLPGLSAYEVREGGRGAGTVVRWTLESNGKRVRDCFLDVSEPSKGELVEKDRGSSMVTTWRVTPGSGDGAALVSVRTTWQSAGGVNGLFERFFSSKGLERIYGVMLARLAAELER
ncbi:polyketide cyclase [Streptomyces nanshensis]|nr:polyketide cyclase [Streptomyces nanshensis]